MYETNEKGEVNGQYMTPSGDPTFKTADGKRNTFPIGTYIIEETEPPTGYLLPSCQGRTFIEVITAEEGSENEEINTYHTEIYKPISTESGTTASGTPYTYTGLNWPVWKIDGE